MERREEIRAQERRAWDEREDAREGERASERSRETEREAEREASILVLEEVADEIETEILHLKVTAWWWQSVNEVGVVDVVHERECVVFWFCFSNPRTKCIHCDNCLVISGRA